MDKQKIQQYGDKLYEALDTGDPIDPITDHEPSITIEDAYAIQLRMIERRLQERNEHIIGKKIGLTSKAVMNMLKFNEPESGHITSGIFCRDRESVALDFLIAPNAEGEIVYIFNHDIEGPGVTSAD